MCSRGPTLKARLANFSRRTSHETPRQCALVGFLSVVLFMAAQTSGPTAAERSSASCEGRSGAEDGAPGIKLPGSLVPLERAVQDSKSIQRRDHANQHTH